MPSRSATVVSILVLAILATTVTVAALPTPFVGTRLVGGQWQSDKGVELSYPLPRPGSCAVFEGQRGKKRRFSRTSSVERVVLRLQVFSITDTGHMPSWAELVEE